MSFQVLLYHGLYRDRKEIAGKPISEYVSEEDFRRQIRWLHEEGFRLLSLRTCRTLAERRFFPERAVCITFDDGKRSDRQLALPALTECGAEATFFIIPGWLGNPNIMAAEELPELVERGMEIGSHSLSHPFLTELDDKQLKREIADSRSFLEDRLGVQVESFSYPFGDADARVRGAVAAAGYRTACTTRRGKNPADPDWLLLRRWSVPGGVNLEGFRRLVRRKTPSFSQRTAEALKRAVGLRRYMDWKERWARRAGA